jgi:uncharacterized protein YkwD
MSDKITRLLCFVFSLALVRELQGEVAASWDNPQSSAGREAISAPKDKQNAEMVAAVHRLVNEFRKKEGLKPLTLDPIISVQASEHSVEMAASGDGISHRAFDQRLQTSKKDSLSSCGRERRRECWL